MACSVMAFHYASWTFGDFDSSTVLGRIGLYGVSFFYILSGLTLYTVYNNHPVTTTSLRNFVIKRAFRIYPLLWLVTIITAVGNSVTDIKLIFLNLTGLFGFITPSAYIGTGVWSIGNELFFYAFFPLLFFLEKKHVTAYYIATVMIFFIGFYFAFFILDRNVSLSVQWAHM